MRVIVCTKNPGLLSFLQFAAEMAGHEPAAADSIQDLCSALYRDPASIGVMTPEPLIASQAVLDIRLADVRNPLFILIGGVSPGVFTKVAVHALERGADDVQPLPIDHTEYAARLAALARRDRGPCEDAIDLPNGCRYMPDSGTIQSSLGAISLSRLETDLLNAIVRHPGKVISKDAAMQHLYAGRDEPMMKIIDVFICKIRRKIQAATGGLDVIETCWGQGYRFVPQGFRPVWGSQRIRAAG